MQKLKNNKIIVILFIIILTLQIIEIVYATNKRQYYHFDEFYSHGLMQYKRAFIFENEDFQNQWHDSEYFKDYLRITNENKWDFSRVYKNQIEDVHPPFWYLLLRIACSFNIGEFSIWPGTILNIIIFAFSSIMLFLIGNKILNNKYASLLLCLLNGCSLASIETVIFVRMYQLLILNTLILVYWHLIKKEKKEFTLKRDLIPLYIMVIIGFLTHYYYAIFVVVLFIMYAVKYIKFKEYKNLMFYTSTLIISILTSILIFPYSIKHIFFSYMGIETISNIKKIKSIITYLILNIKIINKEFFNGYLFIIFLIVSVLIVMYIIKKYNNKNKCHYEIEYMSNIKYILIPMIIYFIVVSLTSPYYDLRYIMAIIPLVFCSLFSLMWILLYRTLNQKISISILLILIIILSLTTIPKLSNTLYTFECFESFYSNVKKHIENKNVLYIYEDVSAQYNRIMTPYNLILTEAPNTYILSDKEASAEKISDILENINISNGIVLIVDEKEANMAIDEIEKTNIFKKINGLCKINLYNIYLLN